MEEEIMKLLKSNNSEDNFLGVILAMTELGETWCRVNFNFNCNSVFNNWAYISGDISVIRHKGFSVNIKRYPTYEGSKYTTESIDYIYDI